MNNVGETLPGEAIAALEQGNKIAAIKSVRLARGVGLKEAKDIVEQYLDRTPCRRNARRVTASLHPAYRALLNPTQVGTGFRFTHVGAIGSMQFRVDRRSRLT